MLINLKNVFIKMFGKIVTIVNKNIFIEIRHESLKSSNIRHESLVIGWHEFQHSLDVVFLSLTETTTPFGYWSIRLLIRFCVTATSSPMNWMTVTSVQSSQNFVLYLKICTCFVQTEDSLFWLLEGLPLGGILQLQEYIS